jgi:hypothetical protein
MGTETKVKASKTHKVVIICERRVKNIGGILSQRDGNKAPVELIDRAAAHGSR